MSLGQDYAPGLCFGASSTMAGSELGNPRLVKLLLQLQKGAKSGVVRLERRPERKQLVLRDGCLAFAESTVGDEHLARILVKLSLLDRKDVAKVAASMKAGKSSYEAIAEATGLSNDKIEEGAREQVVTVLASLLTWNGAEPKLYSCDGLPLRRCDLQMPVPEALMLAARRAAARQLGTRSLPLHHCVTAASESRSLAGMLPLDSAEIYAYAQAQSRQTLGDFLHLLPGASAKPAELALRLILLGLLKLESPEARPQADAAEQTATTSEQQIEELLSRFEIAGYYETLSVPSDANEAQVQAAYYDLARKYHPDRFESKLHGLPLRKKVERLFTYITAAYTTLSDPVARARYDETRKEKESQIATAMQARTAADLGTEKMAESLFKAGCAALAENNLEKAKRYLQECVFLHPEVAKYQHYHGVVLAKIPQCVKEAEQHLLRALEIDSMRVDSRLELGKLYMDVNLLKRAETQFHAVLGWDPENKTARRLLDKIGSAQSGGRGATPRSKPPLSR